jgi:uncharacterized RDD family membrane protein YckC
MAAAVRAQDQPSPPATADDREVVARGHEVVAVGHEATVAEGEHVNELVAVFGSLTNKGEVADNAVAVIGDAQILGPVGGQVVAVLGSVYINSRVSGDVVAVLGDVTLGPNAEIHGQIVNIMGNLQRDPAAIVHGGIERILGGAFGASHALRTWVKECLLYARPLAFAPGLELVWGLALALLAFYALIAVLFTDGVRRCAETLEREPGPAILMALLVFLLSPVVVVLLAITIIGAPVIPLFGFALFWVGIFGRIVTLAWIGSRCLRLFKPASAVHPAVQVLAGGVVVLALYVVPVLGFITYLLVGMLGFGAVCYTMLGAVRNAREQRAAMAAPGAQGIPGASATHNERVAEPAAASAAHAAEGPASATAPPPAAPADPAAAAAVALPRAGFWIRMAALGLDALLVGIVLSILAQPPGEPPRLELLGLAAYGAAMWKWKNTTVGGIVCDLKVVRLDGRPIDWGTAVVRALSCFLSLAVVGLGFLWIAFDTERQAWHDKIAGTVVVRVPKGAPLL